MKQYVIAFIKLLIIGILGAVVLLAACAPATRLANAGADQQSGDQSDPSLSIERADSVGDCADTYYGCRDFQKFLLNSDNPGPITFIISDRGHACVVHNPGQATRIRRGVWVQCHWRVSHGRIF